jgi:hypothetical protein
MNIYNQNNQLVFSLVANANQGLITDFVFLAAGTYSIEMSAFTPSGSPAPSILWSLAARSVSNPQNPVLVNPTSGGSGSGSGSGSSSTGSGGITYIPPVSSPTT